MKIVVLDDYQGVVGRLDAVHELDGLDVDVELRVLTERFAEEAALVEAVGRDCECVVLIRERSQITAAVIAALPRLRLIVQTGRLSGAIDLEACRQRGIEVRDGTGNPIAPAELTWALVLAASRRIVPYARQLEAGRWQRSSERVEDERLGHVLHGRSLGVWALGKIGARVAAYGRAFGMTVLVHGREQSRAAAEQAGYELVADRREFLGRVDVLTLHLKLTPETRHMVSAEDLLPMRRDSILVNTSRAELLAPGALLAALAQGRPGQAALDVFEDEPAGVAAYLSHPAILCTPHFGFVEQTIYEALFREAFGHVRTFLEATGKP
jgi:D-3-phosphoglycerate dehydrogenase / 2-oxoglutarate reductase